MLHKLFSYCFFFFSTVCYCQKETKLSLVIEPNKTDLTIDSSELIITTTIKNNTLKTYYMTKGFFFTTCDNNLSFFWRVNIQFNDSTKLYGHCVLASIIPTPRRWAFKLKAENESRLTFKVNLKDLVSLDDHKRNIKQNTHFGNYSVNVSYCDRDQLNNKSQSEVFISNKVYFTYQK